ncbi:Uncharacterised protein [Vibrio cholerae]|nr:Uncharacterised protein [Vibrio cholerae]
MLCFSLLSRYGNAARAQIFGRQTAMRIGRPRQIALNTGEIKLQHTFVFRVL